MIPDQDLVYYVETYVAVAFSLKVLSIIHLLIQQVSSDIFLVDWEKPSSRKLPSLSKFNDKQNRLLQQMASGQSLGQSQRLGQSQGQGHNFILFCFLTFYQYKVLR